MKKMIDSTRRLYIANKQPLLYLFFGVCTTAINMACYWLLYDVLVVHNVASTILAWLAAVFFAFFTNKIFVFESNRTSTRRTINEITAFFGCRVLTGLLDVAIMTAMVDMLNRDGLLWKLISNIVVTIINYIASKFFIFKQ